jgi:hypothetical protein
MTTARPAALDKTAFQAIICAPIGIAMLLAARHHLMGQERTGRGHFDVPGAVLATVDMTGVVYAVIASVGTSWNGPIAITITAGLAGVALLVGFVVHESRAAQPIMPLRPFADRRLPGPDAVSRRDDRVLVHHPVPARRARLQPVAGRVRVPADFGGQLRAADCSSA